MFPRRPLSSHSRAGRRWEARRVGWCRRCLVRIRRAAGRSSLAAVPTQTAHTRQSPPAEAQVLTAACTRPLGAELPPPADARSALDRRAHPAPSDTPGRSERNMVALTSSSPRLLRTGEATQSPEVSACLSIAAARPAIGAIGSPRPRSSRCEATLVSGRGGATHKQRCYRELLIGRSPSSAAAAAASVGGRGAAAAGSVRARPRTDGARRRSS